MELNRKVKNKENEPVLMELWDKNRSFSVFFHLLCIQKWFIKNAEHAKIKPIIQKILTATKHFEKTKNQNKI